MWVCASAELTGGTPGMARGRPGDTTWGRDGERTRSCGLAAPGNVMSLGLPRWVMSFGLLGLTPGGYPWARAGPPHRRKITAQIAFITRLAAPGLACRAKLT